MKTDNEIIKALDSADVFLRDRADTHTVPLDEYDIAILIDIANTCDEAANLINRQKAEIDRLKESRDTIVKMKRCIGVKKEVESDAVKKFTDKLFNELAGYENMFDELQDWSARNTVLQLTHALKKFVDNNEKYEEAVIKL